MRRLPHSQHNSTYNLHPHCLRLAPLIEPAVKPATPRETLVGERHRAAGLGCFYICTLPQYIQFHTPGRGLEISQLSFELTVTHLDAVTVTILLLTSYSIWSNKFCALSHASSSWPEFNCHEMS